MRSHNLGSASGFFKKFCTMKGAKRYMKQDVISQVNVYVMDILWILCDVYVYRSRFNRGLNGFVKKLL